MALQWSDNCKKSLVLLKSFSKSFGCVIFVIIRSMLSEVQIVNVLEMTKSWQIVAEETW